MIMPPKTQSVAAYRELVESGRARTIAAYVFVVLDREQVPMNRRQIVAITEGPRYPFRLRINTIPAATARLLEDGIIRIAYKGEDEVTGAKDVEYLEVVTHVERPKQRTFDDFARQLGAGS